MIRILQVVAAALSPSQRDLVVWFRAPPHEGDADSFGFFTAHVLSLETGHAHTPRIDVHDHSEV